MKDQSLFVPYSSTRKQMIICLKDRIASSKPTWCPKYGTKRKSIGVLDYAVYAALRGADLRRGDQRNAERALESLRTFIVYLNYYIHHNVHTSKSLKRLVSKWLPEGTQDIVEFLTILTKECNKYS